VNAPERHLPMDDRPPLVVDAIANQLPPAARDLLVRASQVRDPRERRIAIDAAIERVKVRFPDCFQPIPKE
jgi:hypothetical protein